jgi:hypothetical protein
MGETNGETYGEASCTCEARGDTVAFLREVEEVSPVLEASERPLNERAIVVAASRRRHTSNLSPGGWFE